MKHLLARLNKHFFNFPKVHFESLLTITQDGSSAYFNNIPVLIATHSLVMLLLLLLSLPLLLCMTKDYFKFTTLECAQKLIWGEMSLHLITNASISLKCYKLEHSSTLSTNTLNMSIIENLMKLQFHMNSLCASECNSLQLIFMQRCFRKHHHQTSSCFTWKITQIGGFKVSRLQQFYDGEIQSSSQLVQPSYIPQFI